MSHGPFLRALKELGVAGTWRELAKTRTLKFGDLIGVDKYGNKYFENRVDYPHGQHRWVVYNNNENFYRQDASHVPAEWHGWLHHVTAEPPTATTTGSTHRVEPVKNAHGSSAPYARNLGGVIAAHYPNPSQVRPRGYGLDNHIGSAPGEEAYYTQPGWPMDKRNATRFQSTRKSRVGFTLADTPLTLAAKAAARAGLSLQEYRAYTDDESPTKALLQLTDGEIGAREAAALVEQAGGASAAGADVLIAGAAGVPEDPAKRAVAVALAQGLAVRTAGTFAAEAAELLTPAEEAVLADGADVASLKNKAATYQRYVDDYKDIKGKQVAAAVAKAAEARDALLAKVVLLESATAKLASLADKYDSRAYDMARQAVQDSIAELAEGEEAGEAPAVPASAAKMA